MDSQGARGWAPGSYFKHVNGQVDISEDDSTPNNDTTPIILGKWIPQCPYCPIMRS